jgi:hypothetical protein
MAAWGTSEHDAVLEIAKGIWLKRRFQLFLMVEGIKNAANPDHSSYDVGIGLQNFLTHAKTSPEDAFSQGSRFLSKGLLEAFQKNCPKTNFKSEAEWFAAVQKEITLVLPLLDAAYSDSEAFALKNSAATFSGELFERAIALDERLNAMIARSCSQKIERRGDKTARAKKLGRVNLDCRISQTAPMARVANARVLTYLQLKIVYSTK